jgi:hypothetical protein
MTVDGLPSVFVPPSPGTATQSCSDAEAYAKGSVQYLVTSVYGRWVGATSAASAVYWPGSWPNVRPVSFSWAVT